MDTGIPLALFTIFFGLQKQINNISFKFQKKQKHCSVTFLVWKYCLQQIEMWKRFTLAFKDSDRLPVKACNKLKILNNQL